jgi:hypothetical protein
LFHEVEKEEVVVGVVAGMEYLVCLANVGMRRRRRMWGTM